MLSPKNRKKQRNKKIISILLVLAVLLMLAGFTAGRQGITVPEEILQVVAAPVQGVFQRLTRSVESVFATVKNYQLLLAENKQLREQLKDAVTLEERLYELRRENDRLRQMLDLRRAASYEFTAAEVIARDPGSWFNTTTINKGKIHGVEENMAVITTDGLIGKILSTSLTTAHVQLLTDSRLRVSSLVQRSREPGAVQVGVVEHDAANPGTLRMIDLPRDANILPGDTIISSGLGGVFPKGFVIGYVMSTGVDELGLTQYAVLQPATNFNRLEEVFVVIPKELPDVEEIDETEETNDETDEEGESS